MKESGFGYGASYNIGYDGWVNEMSMIGIEKKWV